MPQIKKPSIPQLIPAPSVGPIALVWVQDKFPMKAGDRQPISKARRGSEYRQVRFPLPLPSPPLVVLFFLFISCLFLSVIVVPCLDWVVIVDALYGGYCCIRIYVVSCRMQELQK